MSRPIDNPPNPWSSQEIEWIGEPPPARLEVYEESARSVLTENDSPDLAMRFSVNPYRGCHHGCVYCYARRSHQYLGFGAGTDFERKIVVKINAPEVLERELAKRDLGGETIVFSGNTDCYQPLEAHYRLTRRCLEVAARRGERIAIITKSMLVRRDRDLLAQMAADGLASVFVSIPFADDRIAKRIEPFAPTPTQRFETIAALSSAGVPCGVSLAPLIPGLNDAQIPEILTRAFEAGARRAFQSLVRLSGEVQNVFKAAIEREFPDRANKIMNGIKQSREGAINDSRYGRRFRGSGPRWEAAAALFDLHVNRLGMNRESQVSEIPGGRSKGPLPVEKSRQGRLF